MMSRFRQVPVIKLKLPQATDQPPGPPIASFVLQEARAGGLKSSSISPVQVPLILRLGTWSDVNTNGTRPHGVLRTHRILG